jgi:hypothetical protein
MDTEPARKRPGPKPRPPAERLGLKVGVRFTPQQAEAVAQAAHAAGLPLATHIRDCATGACMRWVSVAVRLPPREWPTLIWGDRLQEDAFPELARLCHDGTWLLLSLPEEDDAAAHTARMVGNVTHWLAWKAPRGVPQ